jgi:hypothetical protein
MQVRIALANFDFSAIVLLQKDRTVCKKEK